MNKRPSCKLILKDMYIERKAKELKLYHLYQNIMEYRSSLSKAKIHNQNLKISIDDNNNRHIEKKNYLIFQQNQEVVPRT